jgi:uncharacterized protein YlzI (FlbEa/FlbD family)
MKKTIITRRFVERTEIITHATITLINGIAFISHGDLNIIWNRNMHSFIIKNKPYNEVLYTVFQNLLEPYIKEMEEQVYLQAQNNYKLGKDLVEVM